MRTGKVNPWTILRANLGLVLLGGAVLVIAFSAHNLPASLYIGSTHTTVEIDGVNFGSFDKIRGLDLTEVRTPSKTGHTVVSLQRDFVTDPSLYLWARNISKQRQGLKDVHLVKRSENGSVIATYVLKLCQPVSWTVEAANPALGGFNETVELAIQDLEIY